ncbi:hypothetical protein RKD52_001580 [Metabacillus sp. SLBN-84]
MKKLLAAALLLLSCSVYILFKLLQSQLHLPHFSADAVNPISFEWNSINIDTKFQVGEPGSVYRIWLTPIYVIAGLSLILMFLPLKKRKSKV